MIITSRARRVALAALTAAALTAGLGGCGKGGDAAPAAEARAGVDWRACGLPGQPARQCGTVEVPWDAERPDGPKVSLAVTRLPASDTARRIGALMWNPGGPGIGGRYVPAALLPPELAARFDLIGFDTRGTLDSGVLAECGEAEGAVGRLAEAEDLGKGVDKAAVDRDARAYVKTCAGKLGGDTRAGHLGSRDTARDMDAIRAALGEDRISLLMGSYGTVYAQAYLAAHPDRVRAAVLDSTLDPSISGVRAALDSSGTDEDVAVGGRDPRTAARDQLRGLLSGYVPWCRSDQAACPSAADPLAPALAAAGLDTGTGAPDDARVKAVTAAAQAAALVPDRWPALAKAFQSAPQDDLAAVRKLGEQGPPKEIGNPYPSTLDLGYNLGVYCADFAWASSPAGVLDDFARADAASGPNASSYVSCGAWPRPQQPLGAAHSGKAPKPLVLNADDDPRTGLAGARAVAERLGGALVHYPGRSHIGTTSGIECAQKAAVAYLVSGSTKDLPGC
ncbi:alpha/beta fold hydrolase [Streptomyces sp. NPDC001941]|uniref:alpha/beta fold hydrolase n=1 Tax=Streptomyces sp. NPDC001941 TaxID=3154659 RepID=UPI00332A6FBF